MSPTALIAEDEPLLAASLRAELGAVWTSLSTIAAVGDGISAVRQALLLQPDVCFLDIRMPGMTGLEVAEALAEEWPVLNGTDAPKRFPLLVFVTAYDQYALKAFEAQAMDYLIKPVERPRLAACVQRLQARLAERSNPVANTPADIEEPSADPTLQQTLDQLRALLALQAPVSGPTPERLQVIQAQSGSVVQMVPVEEVIYLEAADKYVRVMTAHREHLIRMSLRELLPLLDPARFWQVHRGTVVQARCITSALRDESGKVTLDLSGRPEKIAVSRLYAPRFKGM